MNDEPYERLLSGLDARLAEVAIVTGCLESLEGLAEEDSDLTLAERDWVETSNLEISRLVRRALVEAVKMSRQLPPLEEYPQPDTLEPARWHAGELFSLLQDLPEEKQLVVVGLGRQYKSWSLMERYCEEAVVQASRDLERAAFLARVAQVIAERFQGTGGWPNRIRGYALAHVANILRVKGGIKAARAAMEEAKRLWRSGSDPDGVLDPGRAARPGSLSAPGRAPVPRGPGAAGGGPASEPQPGAYPYYQRIHPGGDGQVRTRHRGPPPSRCPG